MKDFKQTEYHCPGFVSVHIECTEDTVEEAQELFKEIKKLLYRQNARRLHDGRPAMAYKVKIED